MKSHTLRAASLISLAIFSLAGCSSAKKANEVAPAYVPSSNYSGKSCDQLIADAESVRRATPGLEAAVDAHRSQQTGVEVVTWVLFWPAAFLLDKGEKQSADLAQAKGELEAIRQAMVQKRCGS